MGRFAAVYAHFGWQGMSQEESGDVFDRIELHCLQPQYLLRIMIICLTQQVRQLNRFRFEKHFESTF